MALGWPPDQSEHFDNVLLVAFAHTGNNTPAPESIEAKAVLLLLSVLTFLITPLLVDQSRAELQ